MTRTEADGPRRAHFAGLERIYAGAPINGFYRPTMEVGEGRATIRGDVSERFFHAGSAVHGSVYFKMLDDAAFFAANSLIEDVMVLTTTFTTYLTRPVSAGTLRSEGVVVNRNRSQIIAEAVLFDDEGRELGRGSGIFVRSKLPLEEIPGYTG